MNRSKIDFSPGSEDRQKVKTEFNLPRWEPFRKWFFPNFDEKLRNYISDKFYKFLVSHNVLFPFVPWFMSNYIEPYISVLERDYKLLNGKIIKGILPPQQPFYLEKENNIVSFTAFSKIFENDILSITVKQNNQIIEQQNYTNIYLNILGEQILSLHKRIDLLLKKFEKSSSPESSGKKVVIATPPLQPPPEIKDYKLKSMSDLK